MKKTSIFLSLAFAIGVASVAAMFWVDRKAMNFVANGSKAVSDFQWMFLRTAIWNYEQRGNGAYAILMVNNKAVQFPDEDLRNKVVQFIGNDFRALTAAWSSGEAKVHSYIPCLPANNQLSFVAYEGGSLKGMRQMINIELGEILWCVGIDIKAFGISRYYIAAGGSREYALWKVDKLPSKFSLAALGDYDATIFMEHIEAAINGKRCR
jgi:hypothetical protein